eukprot:TRINITY_DN757_c0_g1_i2.p1 TRINITY_DN757_c0_g1~~TRINITY_DN757_c0_g1_i2.p1  ORF type:complete len:509 (+),score=76.06 TRINITY_DN757_c0_g1_i2:293-1819(+)
MPTFADAASFGQALHSSHKWHQDKAFVLMIDEVDGLLLYPSYRHLCDAIRQIRDLKQFQLISCCCIGTFAAALSQKDAYTAFMTSLTSDFSQPAKQAGAAAADAVQAALMSPFTQVTLASTCWFTSDAIVRLIDQYKQDWQLSEFDPRIAVELFEETNGHPGVVCVFLRQLHVRCTSADMQATRGGRRVLWTDWRDLLDSQLFYDYVISFQSTQYLVADLQQAHWRFLSQMLRVVAAHDSDDTQFVYSVPGTDASTLAIARFCALVGIISPSASNTTTSFVFSHPVARNLAQHHWYHLLARYDPPTVPVPLDTGTQTVALVPFLTELIKCVPSQALRSHMEHAGKKAEQDTGVVRRGDRVPAESCYHEHMFGSAVPWLKTAGLTITTQTLSGYNRRVDVMIRATDNVYKHRDLIGLAASVRHDSSRQGVLGHIDRAKLYQQHHLQSQLSCCAACVFFSVGQPAQMTFDDDIAVIYAWHSAAFDRLFIQQNASCCLSFVHRDGTGWVAL